MSVQAMHHERIANPERELPDSIQTRIDPLLGVFDFPQDKLQFLEIQFLQLRQNVDDDRYKNEKTREAQKGSFRNNEAIHPQPKPVGGPESCKGDADDTT